MEQLELERVCKTCGHRKSIDQFKRVKRWRLRICKKCLDLKRHALEQTEKYKEFHRKAVRKYRRRHPGINALQCRMARRRKKMAHA
jgi:hypothetical protein